MKVKIQKKMEQIELVVTAEINGERLDKAVPFLCDELQTGLNPQPSQGHPASSLFLGAFVR